MNTPKNKSAMIRFLSILTGFTIIFSLSINPVFAQDQENISLGSLNIDSFPEIQLDFEVYDSQGQFISDLDQANVILSEDNNPVEINDLFLIEPGLQFIIAMNNSPFLQRQYDGASHYVRVQNTLSSWASGIDRGFKGDMSLTANTGLQIVRQNNPAQWADALESYQPDLANEQPGIASLSHALDLATDPNPDERMKRAILYITPPPAADTLEAYANLAERAAQLNTRIFVWLIAPMTPVETNGSEALTQLAMATGGELFVFNGQEPLPNIQDYLDPLRYLYQVNFNSQARESGRHEIQVTIKKDEIPALTAITDFEIQIAPPNPIFMNPPAQINRKWIEVEEPYLDPYSFPLELLIEFPDGFNRPIIRASLYVDDQLILEKQHPPFEQYEWILNGFDVSDVHNLRIEVEDSLGLTSSTIDTQVEIVIEAQEKTLLDKILSGNQLIVIIALSIAAVVLILVLMGRKLLNVRVQTRKRQKSSDPVTQPVDITQEVRKPIKKAPVTSIPREKTDQSPARLVYLDQEGKALQKIIPLHRIESTLGSDPNQSIHVLDSPSIDALHARIHQSENGRFILADANSIAGTWVNYTPISTAGTELEDGDLIQIGRLSFKFEIDRT